MKKILSLLLSAALLLSLAGCGSKPQDLMEGIESKASVPLRALSGEETLPAVDFGLRLMKAADEGTENTLLSPLSVLLALAMTANGTDGETRAQLEALFGMELSELNSVLALYRAALPQGETAKLSLANSIWLNDQSDLTVRPEFLGLNADYYDAALYKAPFDKGTLREINRWVKEKTDGMIPAILNNLKPDVFMVLLNALAFEADWEDPYDENQVWDGEFTLTNGDKVNATFLRGREYSYLENENCTGFRKRYNGGYDFVALLPREGMTPQELLKALDGETLSALLFGNSEKECITSIPKFDTESSFDLVEPLVRLGAADAFDSAKADFSRLLGDGCPKNSIYIGEVIHKTYLSLGEKGTRAGAATAVVCPESAPMEPEKPKEVHLDRPFLYFLIDREQKVPFFIGTMMDPTR